MAPFRLTMATRGVLRALLNEPAARHYGYGLSRTTGLRSGVLYPILARLLDHGWLSDKWEDAKRAHGVGRPARRYYLLTDAGREGAAQALRRTEA